MQIVGIKVLIPKLDVLHEKNIQKNFFLFPTLLSVLLNKIHRIMKKILLLTFVFCVIIFKSSFSQDWIGYSSSNYAGINAILFNPAEIVDSRYSYDMSLAGVYLGFDNNYIGIHKGGFFLNKMIKDTFNYDYLKNKYNIDSWDKGNRTKVARLTIQQDALGPSVLIPINPKNAFAISTRFRNYANIDNVAPELAKNGIEGLADPEVLKQTFQSDNFRFSAMSWREFNFSYAMVIPISADNKTHFLKAGLTLKYLQSYFSAYMYGKNIKYNFTNSDTISLFDCSVSYGHTSNIEIAPITFYSAGIQASGLGLDLGVVYEYRPNYMDGYLKQGDGSYKERMDINKYKIKAGFSITDLGGIKFNKDPDSYDFTANVINWNIYPLTVNHIQEFDDTLNNRWPTVDPSNQTTYKMGLPLDMKIYADYNFKHNIFFNVGMNLSPSMKNKLSKLHNTTGGWLIPRYENKWFGVGIPLSFTTMGHFDAGLFTYLGPIYIGSPDLIRNAVGADVHSVKIYFGIKVPVPQSKTEKLLDRDQDGVLDINDACPDVIGPVENKGCPYADKDGDGVLDNADKCIDTPGPKENNGCPYGDRDKDGVLDNADHCIDVAGPVENNGCPYGDKDNDGVLDNADQCIDVAGPIENNGCPYGDKDQDGVLDKDDACIDAPGPVENKGCPYLDTDGDGVLDKDDQCIKTPGSADNHGCPKLEQKEEEIIKRAFDNLEFDTGKDIIREKSFASLNELAALLVSKPQYGLRIAGHTDNVGDDAKNMQLSHDRSQAVKNYLVAHGANADKIIVEYYGETRPIADNSTPEGRQKNRRVEMTIIFE